MLGKCLPESHSIGIRDWERRLGHLASESWVLLERELLVQIKVVHLCKSLNISFFICGIDS